MELEDTGERLIADGNEKTLTYGEHLSRYSAVKDIVQGKTVLDIASGTGYGTQLIAGYAKKAYGVDYSEDAIKYCQKHHQAKNLEYKVGDAHDIPLEDNSVDVVVSLETIEHLKSPEKFVTEVKRVMNDDGVFVVSTPNDDEFTEGNVFHIHEFTLGELEKLMKKHFKYVQYYYQGTYYAAALLGKDKFTKAEGWDGLVQKTFGQPINKAIYFIALASNKPLKGSLTENLVVADSWNAKEDMERHHERQNHIDSLNTRVGQVEKEIQDLTNAKQVLQKEKDALHAEVQAIKGSRAWKLVDKARKIKHRISPS